MQHVRDNNLYHNEALATIGGKHGKSVGQVVLRWLDERAAARDLTQRILSIVRNTTWTD